ncbi:MAG: hypothetical protein ACLVB2_06030 [Clostridium fessum]
MEYLKCYSTEKREDLMNTERGIMRKVSTVKSFYNYFTGLSGFRITPLLFCASKIHEKKLYASMLTRWRVS